MTRLALLTLGALLAACTEAPLKMSAADVAPDPWLFRAAEIEISCCYSGQVVVIGPQLQVYGFDGSRFAEQWPVTRLGRRHDLTLDDFEPAHEAARRLARIIQEGSGFGREARASAC